MRYSRWLLCLSLLLVVGLPLWALSGGRSDQREQNQARLAEIRKNPEDHARLVQEARAFLDLPEKQREQLRQFDHDLYQLPAARRDMLTDVMKRYAAWLARLPVEQRRKIEQAPNMQARLEIIRQIREQQWAQTLPKVYRDQLAKLEGRPRQELLDRLRLKDKEWKARWKLAFNHWPELAKPNRQASQFPAHLEDLPKDVQTFVNEYLKPRLSPEEQARLKKTEGRWPLFLCTLVDLADHHPPALPSKFGPTQFNQLPKEVQEKFKRAKAASVVMKAAGKWPAFAIKVTQVARNQSLGALPHELWPIQQGDLLPPMRQFIEQKLRPVLTEDEMNELDQAEKSKSWPRYPLTIRKLAAQHYLRPPWYALPPARAPEFWNSYRVKNYELVQEWSK
jgi:hypothetical protein